jgi:hypothetical protein
VLPPSPVISEWPATLAAALRAAESGDFEGADRTLLDFGLRNAGKPEGTESDFWRALIKADPLNDAPTNRERMALFDAYLAAGTSAPRYTEAMIFRRILEAVDSTRTALAGLRAANEQRQRSREEEIRKLSDDLDRTMAELDRIKKRLAPRPPQ